MNHSALLTDGPDQTPTAGTLTPMNIMHHLPVLLILCIVTFAGGGTIAAAQDDAAQASLIVDAGQSLGAISPYVYGANYSALGIPPVDLMPALEVAGLTFLRFPGGRWGDLNNIQHFQLDLYIRQARQIGAEPSISVRLENGTPEQAAELVRYANIENDYNVRYWMIGNEPNLFDNYTVADLNREWRPIAEAMLAVDPDIILMGPDLSQFTGDPAFGPFDSEGQDWLREFMRANGDLIDVVTVHRYPFPRSQANPLTTTADLQADTRSWDILLPGLRAAVEEVTGRSDYLYALTEVNSHWSATLGGEATSDSFYNALWWADVLGRLIRDGAHIVAYYSLQSSDRLGGWGLLSTSSLRPTYYVYLMYQRFGTELVYSSAHDDPDVSVYAALREDGALTIMVINLASEEHTRTLQLDNFSPSGEAEVWRFDAAHNAEQVEAAAIAAGGEITVPGQSVTLFIVPAE